MVNNDFCAQCEDDLGEFEDQMAESAFHQFTNDFKMQLGARGLGTELANKVSDFAEDLMASFLGRAKAAAAGVGAPRRPAGQAPRRPPPPPPPEPTLQDLERAARSVMNFGSEKLTKKMVRDRRIALSRIFHPDHGGDTEAMQRINAAADLLEQLAS